MARPARGRRRGHTLVEAAVSTVIFTVISAGVFTLIRSASGVLSRTMGSSIARRHCSDFASVLADELANCNPVNLAIDTSHAEGDRLHMQLPLSVSGGVVTWGGQEHLDGIGKDRKDTFVDYLLVQEGNRKGPWQLVRRLADAGGTPLSANEVVLDQVDVPVNGNGNGKNKGKGFTATRGGHLVNLSVRVRHVESGGGDGSDDVVRVHQFTIQLRNSGEDVDGAPSH